MTFEELQLDSQLLRGIKDMGFTALTPVQEKTLAISLTGRDVAVQSQTGTGKTAAFLITI
ncbi:MAG: DEAD/DEAH box helicase, partial [Acidobacteriota bacterium]|nr:DEAD/DEAH box helicase [Acidobacteriota bacterium]